MKWSVDRRLWLWLIGMFIVPSLLQSQNEHRQWHFGYGAGLEFSTGSPLPITGSAMNTDEGCTSMCDATGTLQFYSDGVTVWNRQHNPMPNGTGLLGGISSSQSALTVKVRGVDSLYLLFTVAAQLMGGHSGLSYSVVDMRLDNGRGDVVQKNVLLCDSTTEKLTATRAANGSDVWVVTHRWYSDAFYAYRVTCPVAGVPQIVGPVISHVGSVIGFDGAFNPTATSIGCMKISPDGQRLAMVWSRYLNDTSGDSESSMEWFDFDAGTGVVSNPARLDNPQLRSYGCAFSPSSRYLYVTTYGLVSGIAHSDIRQYDLHSANVPASEVIVANAIPEFGSLQLGPDGRLYVARLSFSTFISAIVEPDSGGTSCDFQAMGAALGTGMSTWGLPNHWDSYEKPEIWTYRDTVICPHQNFLITANIPGALGWLWSNGSTDPSIVLSDSGEVTMEVYLACDTLRDSLSLHYRYCDPNFLPGRSAEICHDDGLALDATQHDALAYQWRYGETEPAIMTNDTGWIWVDVTFDHGTIRDSIYLTHRDCECVVAHNVFSPNADGINDVFQPRVDCELEMYRLAIYDRWGKQLFQTQQQSEYWDGRLGDVPVPESVYYYVVEWKQYAENGQFKLGSLMLLR